METVLSLQLDELGAHADASGYRRKHMTEQFDTKAAEIRARILAAACPAPNASTVSLKREPLHLLGTLENGGLLDIDRLFAQCHGQPLLRVPASDSTIQSSSIVEFRKTSRCALH